MIKIERVANGYILRVENDDGNEIVYVFNNTESEVECIVDLLYTIKEEIGFFGNRWEERGDIEIKVVNGRKYEETV